MLRIWLAWIAIIAFSAIALWTLLHTEEPKHFTANLIVYGLSLVAGTWGFARFVFMKLRR
jgi:hypothetical protein